MKTVKPTVATLGARIGYMEPGSWRASNATSADRGYGRDWRKARLEFLKKHPLCERCKAEGIIAEATVVDHDTPHRGDQAIFWDKTRWRAICLTHHNRDKQREEAAAR